MQYDAGSYDVIVIGAGHAGSEAGLAAAILVGCKKEKQEVKVCDVKPNNQVIGNMDDYLISFKKRMLSATKGDESISLEQAQRDLGNLLNFDFGDANYATDEIQYDTEKAVGV